MNRSIPLLSILLVLAFASVANAQTPVTCGIVAVEGPADVVPGEPIVFKAKLTGLTHTPKLDLKWRLSSGTIVSGEGTDAITVDTAGLVGIEVIATAELSGVPPGCSGSASGTTRVKNLLGTGLRKFDEYGDLNFRDEKARLDNFAIHLQHEPLSNGYILMYAGQETYRNETAQRLARARSYLVTVRNLDSKRLVTLDCGYRPDLTITLFILPQGVLPAECDPTGTLRLSEVKFTKRPPKAAKKKR